MYKPLFSILFLAVLSGCGGGDSPSLSLATASFSLDISDGPVDGALEVVIQIDGVRLHAVSDADIDFDFATPKSIDLLDLSGSLSEALLSNETIPAAGYSYIELKVSAEEDGIMDSYILTDTGQYELYIPSGSESGLRLVSGFSAIQGTTVHYTVDFDLRKSITAPAALTTSMILRPTLRLVNNLHAGSLRGSVDSSMIAGSCTGTNLGAVYLYSGTVDTALDIGGEEGDPLTTASVNFESPNYRYEFGFLAPGDYTAAYTCSNVDDDPEVVDTLTFQGLTTVHVGANAATDLDFI